MGLSGRKIEEQLLATGYIDSELKELHYDHSKHLVTMRYWGESDEEAEEREYTIFFKECFSVNFNTWLEGVEGAVPQSPNEQAFFIQDIAIREIEMNGVQLYECKMIIPMMDCQPPVNRLQ